jgi:hypothetical protein
MAPLILRRTCGLRRPVAHINAEADEPRYRFFCPVPHSRISAGWLPLLERLGRLVLAHSGEVQLTFLISFLFGANTCNPGGQNVTRTCMAGDGGFRGRGLALGSGFGGRSAIRRSTFHACATARTLRRRRTRLRRVTWPPFDIVFRLSAYIFGAG